MAAKAEAEQVFYCKPCSERYQGRGRLIKIRNDILGDPVDASIHWALLDGQGRPMLFQVDTNGQSQVMLAYNKSIDQIRRIADRMVVERLNMDFAIGRYYIPVAMKYPPIHIKMGDKHSISLLFKDAFEKEAL